MLLRTYIAIFLAILSLIFLVFSILNFRGLYYGFTMKDKLTSTKTEKEYEGMGVVLMFFAVLFGGSILALFRIMRYCTDESSMKLVRGRNTPFGSYVYGQHHASWHEPERFPLFSSDQDIGKYMFNAKNIDDPNITRDPKLWYDLTGNVPESNEYFPIRSRRMVPDVEIWERIKDIQPRAAPDLSKAF
jgi:hypothetical protein